jgi:hypothetical protein
MAVPISIIKTKSFQGSPTSLETLIRTGESLPAVQQKNQIRYVKITNRLDNGWPTDSKYNFSHRNAKITIFVLWDPIEKAKGNASVSIYSLDNKLLTRPDQRRPVKINLRPGQQLPTYWDCAISGLSNGIYRVDVSFNDMPVWRSFFRISD